MSAKFVAIFGRRAVKSTGRDTTAGGARIGGSSSTVNGVAKRL